MFEKNESGQWQPLNGGAITLSLAMDYGASWLVNYYGYREYYDDLGRIMLIEKPVGDVIRFIWGDQKLTIINDQDQTLQLVFNDKQQLVSAKTGGGRQASFEWAKYGGVLTKITRPDGKYREYSYGSSYNLVGITDENGVSFAAWEYDNQGRAISSEHAGGKEKVTLEFHDNNSTTVTDPLGKKTTY
ncbi:RHS repeat protein, partial [Endozoicomonas sp. SM1973]|nr:RHS repeat protein [Spartinivicinus marinus]